jgi:hypothetical protein
LNIEILIQRPVDGQGICGIPASFQRSTGLYQQEPPIRHRQKL